MVYNNEPIGGLMENEFQKIVDDYYNKLKNEYKKRIDKAIIEASEKNYDDIDTYYHIRVAIDIANDDLTSVSWNENDMYTINSSFVWPYITRYFNAAVNQFENMSDCYFAAKVPQEQTMLYEIIYSKLQRLENSDNITTYREALLRKVKRV